MYEREQEVLRACFAEGVATGPLHLCDPFSGYLYQPQPGRLWGIDVSLETGADRAVYSVYFGSPEQFKCIGISLMPLLVAGFVYPPFFSVPYLSQKRTKEEAINLILSSLS